MVMKKEWFKENLVPVAASGISFVLGVIAGILLSFRPDKKMCTASFSPYTIYIRLKYVFDIRSAIGYWIFAIVLSAIVFLLCKQTCSRPGSWASARSVGATCPIIS